MNFCLLTLRIFIYFIIRLVVPFLPKSNITTSTVGVKKFEIEVRLEDLYDVVSAVMFDKKTKNQQKGPDCDKLE